MSNTLQAISSATFLLLLLTAGSDALKTDTVTTYPGYQGNLEVKLDAPITITFEGTKAKLAGTLSGLENSITGGIHVHLGSTCEGAAGHYWEGDNDLDPWLSCTYTTNAEGKSDLACETNEDPYNELAQKSTLGKVIVVHDSNKTRVACGEIRSSSSLLFAAGRMSPHVNTKDEDSAVAKLKVYPGQEENKDIPVLSGEVKLTSDNLLLTDISDATPNADFKVHIHEGFTCMTAGDHYFKEQDGWLEAACTVTSDVNGTIVADIDVSALSGTYDFSENVNHVVVVHNSTGARISCAPLLYIKNGEGHVLFEEKEGELMISGWASGLGAAPGAKFPYHVHVGTTCSENNGGHLLKGDVDPWLEMSAEVVVSTQGVNKYARTQFSSSTKVSNLEDIVGRTFTMHDPNGARVLCAEITGHNLSVAPTSAPSTANSLRIGVWTTLLIALFAFSQQL